MFNLTGSEIMFLLIIGLVVLGPEKLPDAIRRLGRLYAELKRMSSGVQSDLRKVMDEPLKEMMSTTTSVKSLFNETSNQLQSVAKDIVTPSFVPYGGDKTEGVGEAVVLNQGQVGNNLESSPELGDEDGSDDEIAQAIARAAKIANDRSEEKRNEEVQSSNPADDVS